MERMISNWLSGSWTAFFCVLYKSSSIFILGNRFSLRFINFLSTHFTSILQKLSGLSYNSYLHLSLFCRGSRISVSCFWPGFISHTTRISNNTSFLCKRLVVKNKFRNNIPAFTKLKCFALDIQSQWDLTSK